jgi:CHRD domain
MNRLHMTAAAIALVCLAAAPGHAETIPMKAQLTGNAEVPPVTTQAKGDSTMSFDTASKKLTYKLDYSGLSSDATAAHFHGPAEPGANAGVAVPIGTQGQPLKSPTEGSATLTDAQAADLLAGKWYVNVHSKDHPAGEIRGQVRK